MLFLVLFHLLAKCLSYQPQAHFDTRLQRNESSQHTEINHHSMRGELHHPNMNCVCDSAKDRCSIQGSEATSDKGSCGRGLSANRHGRIGVCVWCVIIDKIIFYVKVVNVR